MLFRLTTSSNNTANGLAALESNTGNDNTAIGAFALQNNEDGSGNTAIGVAALQSNTTGLREAIVDLMLDQGSKRLPRRLRH